MRSYYELLPTLAAIFLYSRIYEHVSSWHGTAAHSYGTTIVGLIVSHFLRGESATLVSRDHDDDDDEKAAKRPSCLGLSVSEICAAAQWVSPLVGADGAQPH